MTSATKQSLITAAGSRDPLADGRQSERALEIARGTTRLLASMSMASLPEVTLPNRRRADLLAIGKTGEIWIIEIKSSLTDFTTDSKWPEYSDFCDRFYFAVSPDFPVDVLPHSAGLIVADRYGAEIIRQCPETKIAAARRKVVHILSARAAAARLQRLSDPEADLEHIWRT